VIQSHSYIGLFLKNTESQKKTQEKDKTQNDTATESMRNFEEKYSEVGLKQGLDNRRTIILTKFL
jgi:hypothetical protein